MLHTRRKAEIEILSSSSILQNLPQVGLLNELEDEEYLSLKADSALVKYLVKKICYSVREAKGGAPF
jgi:hypothetical protein